MSHTQKYILTLLAVSGLVLTAPAFAQQHKTTSTAVSTETTTRVTRPLAVDGETKEVKPAIERFVERVNMARMNLAEGDAKQALFSIDEAEKHMRFIKKNSNYKEITKQTVVSSGQVVYNNVETTYNSYYVPLEEGPVVVKEFANTENQSGKSSKKAIAVTSANVVYLTVDLSGEEAEKALASSRAQISEGNLAGANDTLAKMINDITITTSIDNQPLMVARDNLKLALSFLEDDNYVGARFALAHAGDALKDLKKDGTYSDDKVDDVADRVSQIHELVKQETKDTASKARTQIKAAQGDLDHLS